MAMTYRELLNKVIAIPDYLLDREVMVKDILEENEYVTLEKHLELSEYSLLLDPNDIAKT